jgi:hypothetical protein
VFKLKPFLLSAIVAVVMLVGIAGCTPADIQALQGTLQNVDSASGNVTIMLKDGSTQTFNFNNVKVETIRQALGSASLEVGDQVIVRAHKNGNVEQIDVQKAEVDGVIKSLGTNNVTITTEKKGDITLQVTSETIIRVEDKGPAAFSDLQAGQSVEAKYDVSSLKALKLTVDIETEEDNDSEEETDTDDEREATQPITITGTVTSYTSNRIIINGKTIRLTNSTAIQGVLSIGATVEIKAARGEDALVAQTITVVIPGTIPPTTGVTIPAAPSGLTATASGSSQVNLSWTDNSNNETGFKVQRATNSGFTVGLATFTVGAGATTYTNTGLTANTTYYYRVLATNSAGDSVPSNTGTVTTPTSSTAISGASVFAANCTGCHGLSTATGTSRTQSQLNTWIPTHHTGSSLTLTEVAALAAYIKP